MSSGGPETDPQDVGLAETMSPAPGDVATQASDDDAPADAIGGRPVSDRLVRAVSRAKIAGALFATDERVKLGRYHLLELVGSGGMGVVWGAWDPELDRRVAIKLVKATMQSARDRILLEGQALAKLSHPNVVPVFDVGVVDEQVYLVMEWVKGKNLRAYCKQPRSVREIVAVYRDAGLGLSAAHHAGLIHRDFKPDNAIRGDDGRVRVLDFGLAREGIKKDPSKKPDDTPVPSSDLTRGAGTPRYMPPEQAEGGELTPSVDQYAFCVSLREALVGRNADGKHADLPGWIDAIVTRGTAREARGRYPSMDELLRALARDPRTVWRRRAIVTGALGLAGAAFAIGTVRGGGGDVEQCGGGKEEIAKTWNDAVRGAVVAHVASLGEYGKEESRRLDADLTKYAATWANSHRAACQARARSELTPQLYERSVGCLARANVALGTVAGVLSAVPADRLPNAVVAVRELPEVSRCPTEAATSTVEAPAPAIAAEVARVANDVERARVLAFALDPQATEAAAQAAAVADRLQYRPLIAKAELTLGLSWLLQRQHVQAIGPLARATAAAFAAGDDAMAIEAYAREAFAVSVSPASEMPEGAADILGGVPLMEPIAVRLGPSGAFARALFYNNVAVGKMAAAHREEAQVWFRRALDETRLAPPNTELARIPANAALAADARVDRQRLVEESVVALTEMVGPNHSFTLETKLISVGLIGNREEAVRQSRDLCQRFLRYYPHLGDLIGWCAFDTGWLSEDGGDVKEARAWMSLVMHDEVRQQLARGYIMMFDGDDTGAASAMQELVRNTAEAKELWAANILADAYLVASQSLVRLGRQREAIALLERSLAVLEPAAKAYPWYERRLARCRAQLARLIARQDPKRAADLARLAAAWYREVGGDDARVAELEALATP